MIKINLNGCLPRVFSDIETESSLWGKDIVFEKGKKYLVKSESGRGKSSFCSYLIGYRDDYQGAICFDEMNIKTFDAERWSSLRQASLSYLPQGLMLFDEISAIENILIKNALTNYRTREWINSAMVRLGIDNRAYFLVSKLSYGQKQRVALIRALCQPFDFIILDEPTSHLDDNTSAEVSKLLIEEVKASGAGVIVTSIGKDMELDYDKIIHL